MLIALFSIISLNEAKAQCDAGFTPTTYQVTIGSCLYNVTICLQCNVAYPSRIGTYIYYSKVNSNCVQLLNDWEVNSKIYNDLYSAIRLNSLCGLPGPCGVSPRTWRVQEPRCFYKDIDGGVQNCDVETYCEYEISICWDPIKNVFVRTKTLIASFGYMCTISWETNPPIGECFYYNENCPSE